MSALHIIVTIGGLDPGAGAGLGRDLLTARAFGAPVRMVGTAWTEQSERGVLAVEARPPEALEAAVRQALRAPRPGAVKIGMVPGPEQAAAILRALAGYDGPVVVDPVLSASHGGPLWSGPPGGLMPLLRRATLATPNVPEAEALSGLAVTTLPEAERAARWLRQAGLAAVLLKGGHLPAGRVGDSGDLVTDILATGDGERRFGRPRLPGVSPRGTGCALATALAVQLAAGLPLEEATARAGDWLAERIAAAVSLDLDGSGDRQLS
jgi:hydroxymethylpyrimidine/phosphomethylpyrimidine kinase